MNRILIVWIVALTLGISLAPLVGMQPARAATGAQSAPPLQSGINVAMPMTKNAAAMPEADQEDALIATVTSDGMMYLGIRSTDFDRLGGELQAAMTSDKVRRTLYIKADARAPYAIVVRILDIATAAGFEKTVMLTSQNDAQQLGSLVPPKGFTVVTKSKAIPRSKLPM